MKKEDLEANGDEGTKYRKEPSPCPICNKVSALEGSKGGYAFGESTRVMSMSGLLCARRCSPAEVT